MAVCPPWSRRFSRFVGRRFSFPRASTSAVELRLESKDAVRPDFARPRLPRRTVANVVRPEPDRETTRDCVVGHYPRKEGCIMLQAVEMGTAAEIFPAGGESLPARAGGDANGNERAIVTNSRTINPRLLQSLNYLKQFVAERGWEQLGRRTRINGFHLGHWVSMRRSEYRRGTLTDWMRNELESIPGWTWDPTSDLQQRKLDVLRRFAEQRGMARLTTTTRFRGVNLGMWVAGRRRAYEQGRLSAETVAQFESIEGWSWVANENSYDHTLELLEEFIDLFGWDRFRSRTTYKGVCIGAWVTHRRAEHRHGTMAADRARQLEGIPGWTWNPKHARQVVKLDALREFVAEHGWERLTQTTRVGGVALGAWVNSRRTSYKKGRLPDWLRGELEAIPGWKWAER
jgi:uncharacterized protein (DUF2132 family)